MHQPAPGTSTISSAALPGDAATRDGIEAKTQGVRLHRRQSADFQHDQLHTLRVFTPRRVFDELQHAFGERHFMHRATSRV